MGMLPGIRVSAGRVDKAAARVNARLGRAGVLCGDDHGVGRHPVVRSSRDTTLTQRHASPHTVASYWDTFTLLLGYAHHRSGISRAAGRGRTWTPTLIGAFLTHLGAERGNSAATRNARLTAIRALFRHASLRAPDPAKSTDTTIVCFLTRNELDALTAAARQSSKWPGRRDSPAAAVTVRTADRKQLRARRAHPGRSRPGRHAGTSPEPEG
jgi:hypothetical protein